MKIPKQNKSYRFVIFLFDNIICLFSLFAAYQLRFNFRVPTEEYDILFTSLPFYILVRALSFYLGKTYRGIVQYTGVQDAKRIFITLLASSVFLAVINPIPVFAGYAYYFFPFSIIIIDFLIALLLILGSRLSVKMAYQEYASPSREKAKVIIYGAGELGLITKRTIDKDLRSKFKVAGFIDDDLKKKDLRLEGVKIHHSEKLEHLLSKGDIEQLIIGINKLPSRKKQEIIEQCVEAGISVLNVPPVESWINGELSIKQIKQVKIDDLLGRNPIQLDTAEISNYLNGKTILVTGAAGSIGSEIVRQCLKFKPGKVFLLDQAESGLYDLETELKTHFKEASYEIIVADVTQNQRMKNVFDSFKPQVVFHAAAYKHVPLMELNPTEAVKTNVIGTKNLVDLSISYDTEKFVFISTDKAVNPTNVMGASKRAAEIYVQSHNKVNVTQFITTRFGNVLGSNGSVIPLFKKQIEHGGPITITDKNITRYFMTIPEACQLVLEAGAMGKGGEVFVFDMGKPVKIIDLAKKMIKLSGLELGKDIQIKEIGLRPGEKLYEELLSNDENTLPTHHNKILIGKVKEYQANDIKKAVTLMEQLTAEQSNNSLVKELKQLIPEYVSNNSRYSSLDK